MADDPEIQRQNNEATEANTRAREAETESLTRQNKIMLENIAAMLAMSNGGKQSAEAFKKLMQSSDSLTEAQKAKSIADEISAKKQANYNDAVDSSKQALKNFAGAMTNTSTEFGKFNSTLSSAGDAAFSLGKSFGPLGMIIGGIVKGFTKVAEMATKQADNALKATDEMNKMGAAGALTAKEVGQMATSMGLSNEQWGLLPKTLKRAGDSIIGLGGSVAEGQKQFARMAAVTSEQREAFQRLGVSQEELMGYQADYLDLQKQTGMQMVGSLRTEEGRKKASLEYTANLLELAAITGKNVDEAQAMQKQAQAAYEIQLDNARITREIKKAEQEGNTERVRQLEAEQKARNKMLDVVADIGDADVTSGLQKFLATGAITEQSAAFARMGVDMDGFRKRMQAGEDVSADFAQALKDGIARKQEEMGTSLAYSKELGKAMGVTEKTMAWATKRADVDEKSVREKAKAGIAKPSEGKTGKTAAEDPAQIARNAQTTATIELNKTLENLLMESNPLLSGFNKLSTAVTGLTAAALAISGYLAAKSAIGGATSIIKGVAGVGSKAATVAEGAAGAAGVASKAGTAMKVLGTAGKVLGKVAAPLAIASAGYDAYQGYNQADKNLGIKGREATTGEKLSSAAGGALSGLSFGLISPETMSKAIAKATGAGPDEKDKQKQVEEAQLKSEKENTDTTKKLDSTSSSLIKALDALRMSIDDLNRKITSGGAPGGAGGGAPGGAAPPSAGGGAAVPPKDQNVKNNLSSIADALKKKGMDDPNYIKAVLGNVMKETGGKNTSENLDYSKTSNDRIRKIFGSRAEGKSDEELNKIKSSQESMGEFMYGAGTKIGQAMGNKEPGDGWKYRGRGFIQLTGKNNYAAASQAIFGDDRLVKDPDSVLDPNIASQVVAWYMEKTKGSMQAKMGLGSGPLSEADANLLATSQVAGRDVRKGGDYLSGEVMNKVAANAKNMDEFLKTPQAANGGLFSGPDSGYPVTLHGDEAVIPDFKIPDLIASIQSTTKQELPTTSSGALSVSSDDNVVSMLSEMVQMMSDKLDTVISVLEDGNNTSNKILQYSQV